MEKSTSAPKKESQIPAPAARLNSNGAAANRPGPARRKALLHLQLPLTGPGQPAKAPGSGRPTQVGRDAHPAGGIPSGGIPSGGPGQALEPGVRRRMESAFGRDFSQVRVHNDPAAARSAAGLQAQAYTQGRDIYFGAGRYAPQTGAGQRLLAHELAHVAQQQGSRPSGTAGTPKAAPSPGKTSDEFIEFAEYERQANAAAERVGRGQSIPAQALSPAPAGGIQRQSLSDLVESAGETVSGLIESGSELVSDVESGVEGLVGDLFGGLTGGLAPPSPGGIVIPFPDVTLFSQVCFNKAFSGSTGNIPFFIDVIDIPLVGPVLIELYARGDALANLMACLGPALLRNIRVLLDPLASRYSGTAQLYVPAGLLAGIQLSGSLGGLATWVGLGATAQVEGSLIGAGSGSLTSAFIATGEVVYSAGSLRASLGTELDTCLMLSMSLDASAFANLLGVPVWAGRWSLASWAFQRCWRLGAALSIDFSGGFPAISLDLSAEEVPVAEMLPQMLRDSGLVSGLTPSAHVPVDIHGNSELWWFDGERPPGYPLEQPLTATSGGIPGSFRWQILSGIGSADFDGFPTALGPGAKLTSKDASLGKEDVEIQVDFVGAAGETGAASKKFSVQAPDRLHFLRNDDGADPAFVYRTFIHYSIQDQFGAVLPRLVPINEHFTAPPTADFPGMDWRRGGEGDADVNPADWADHVQGETSGHTPAPVLPAAAGAATAVYHWPGTWQVGAHPIGKGRHVASVTWSKSRGLARHT